MWLNVLILKIKKIARYRIILQLMIIILIFNNLHHCTLNRSHIRE